MGDELKFPGTPDSADHDSLGEPAKALIREAYAPRAADSELYWARLESRIMVRIRTEGAADTRWWSVLAPWAQAGLIAAVAIFAVMSLINQRLSEADSQFAYESVVQTPTPDGYASAARFATSDKRAGSDATVDYVLSH